MRFDEAIDLFIEDKRAANEIASKHTEASYRGALNVLAKDVDNRDPGKVGQRDVQRTLGRWPNPRTRAQRHAIFLSFYDWAVEVEVSKYNPARKVRRARFKSKPPVRLTAGEIVAVQDAARPVRRDRWAVELMLYTGARNEMVRRWKGSDFRREGVIRMHGKGDKVWYVPVLPPLEPVVAEILTMIEPDNYVLPGRRSSNPPVHTIQHDTQKMLSSSALIRQCNRIGKRAGIGLELHPHLLRHAFGDAVTRYAGARIAQDLMGHESIQTTVDFYVGRVSIDEAFASLRGFDYRRGPAIEDLSPSNHPEGARNDSNAR